MQAAVLGYSPMQRPTGQPRKRNNKKEKSGRAAEQQVLMAVPRSACSCPEVLVPRGSYARSRSVVASRLLLSSVFNVVSRSAPVLVYGRYSRGLAYGCSDTDHTDHNATRRRSLSLGVPSGTAASVVRRGDAVRAWMPVQSLRMVLRVARAGGESVGGRRSRCQW